MAHIRLELPGVALLNVGADSLHPRPEGWSAFFLVTPAPQDLGALLFSQSRQLLGSASLADARLPGKHDYAALACQRLFEGRPQFGHLSLTANEHTAYVASGMGLYHLPIPRRDSMALRQPLSNSIAGGLGPVGRVDFVQDVANVGGHGSGADEQFLANLRVALARGH